jgi:hypothetical protein
VFFIAACLVLFPACFTGACNEIPATLGKQQQQQDHQMLQTSSTIASFSLHWLTSNRCVKDPSGFFTYTISLGFNLTWAQGKLERREKTVNEKRHRPCAIAELDVTIFPSRNYTFDWHFNPGFSCGRHTLNINSNDLSPQNDRYGSKHHIPAHGTE